MKRQHHNMTEQHSRRDASVRVFGGAAVVVTFVAVAPMLGTLTAKINPYWASGGLPREGTS